jgi:predicted kinase
MANKVVILRGVSGTGKSTFVNKNYPNAIVVSTDKFFETNGEYKFELGKIGMAHSWCFNKYIEALYSTDPIDKSETIVVDNTNIRIWEFANYILLARKLRLPVEVWSTMPTNFSVEELVRRNTHGVPAYVIQKMMFDYEPYKFETPIETPA